MENVLPVWTSVISILNQSGVTVTVATMFGGGSEFVVVNKQADITKAKLKQICTKRNNFTVPSMALVS
jgi:hypothetical protein